MTDEKTEGITGPGRKGPRLHHVAAHEVEGKYNDSGDVVYDEIVVFGTEIEVLRFVHGKSGWVYKRLANGQSWESQP